jgi:hypothetical protein
MALLRSLSVSRRSCPILRSFRLTAGKVGRRTRCAGGSPLTPLTSTWGGLPIVWRSIVFGDRPEPNRGRKSIRGTIQVKVEDATGSRSYSGYSNGKSAVRVGECISMSVLFSVSSSSGTHPPVTFRVRKPSVFQYVSPGCVGERRVSRRGSAGRGWGDRRVGTRAEPSRPFRPP